MISDSQQTKKGHYDGLVSISVHTNFFFVSASECTQIRHLMRMCQRGANLAVKMNSACAKTLCGGAARRSGPVRKRPQKYPPSLPCFAGKLGTQTNTATARGQGGVRW